jgi:hypothetical protein
MTDKAQRHLAGIIVRGLNGAPAVQDYSGYFFEQSETV